MYLNDNAQACACGKIHQFALERVIVGKGVLAQLPEEIRRHGYKKVFVLADANTFGAAGGRVEALLEKEGIPFSKYVYASSPEPDEAAVGAAVMHFDKACDLVLAVGSGVIGDISKILANVSGMAYMIVATAPSMDGYASATSSMTRNGLKVSIPSKMRRCDHWRRGYSQKRSHGNACVGAWRYACQVYQYCRMAHFAYCDGRVLLRNGCGCDQKVACQVRAACRWTFAARRDGSRGGVRGAGGGRSCYELCGHVASCFGRGALFFPPVGYAQRSVWRKRFNARHTVCGGYADCRKII
ncbi:MAG: iron-containing alcohol dehydrogenase [Clostridia bacterium]|nr:iron-containing alcohol dehydrogenase [Clostridia bacterium]